MNATTGLTKAKATKRLISLSASWNEYDLVPKDQQAECRQLGERLDEIGGMEAMIDAYYAAKAKNRCASAIQAYWDGVGDWRW